jgi:exodeoxyribonuclease-1
MRDKKKVEALVRSGKPFVYTSGKFASEHEKTSIVTYLSEHPKNPKSGALVYDLRTDPDTIADMTPDEMVVAWRARKENPPAVPFPAKVMQYNKCPSVAPLNVIDDVSKERLHLDMDVINANFKKFQKADKLKQNIIKAAALLDKEQQASFLANPQTVDAQLYDQFIPDGDKVKMSALRVAEPREISKFKGDFKDMRLNELLPLYKARNFPRYLDNDERAAWETYRREKLLGQGEGSLVKYFARLEQAAKRSDLTSEQQYLLEELQLYGQSVMPEDA